MYGSTALHNYPKAWVQLKLCDRTRLTTTLDHIEPKGDKLYDMLKRYMKRSLVQFSTISYPARTNQTVRNISYPT